MNIEELRDFCLSLKGTEENCPWTQPQYQMLITFSVAGKWYCLADIDEKRINVKCPTDKIPEMQAHYNGCVPAWHMNKTHWLGVNLESDVPDEVIRQLLTEGHQLIVSRLPKKIKAELKID